MGLIKKKKDILLNRFLYLFNFNSLTRLQTVADQKVFLYTAHRNINSTQHDLQRLY